MAEKLAHFASFFESRQYDITHRVLENNVKIYEFSMTAEKGQRRGRVSMQSIARLFLLGRHRALIVVNGRGRGKLSLDAD